GDAGGLLDGLEHRFDADRTRGGDRLVDLDVRLETIARRKDDCTLHARRKAQQIRRDVVGGAAQSFEHLEGGGLVTRRHAQQHLPILRRLSCERSATARVRWTHRRGWEDGSMSAPDAPLLRALAGDRPERTPVWFMRQAGRSLPEYRELRVGTRMLDACLTPELAAAITLQPVRRHGVDAAIFFSDIVVPLRLAGVEVEIEPGRGPVFADPVRSAAD